MSKTLFSISKTSFYKFSYLRKVKFQKDSVE